MSAGSRIYYFDVQEDKKGCKYLTIAELNTRNELRNCIFVHSEYIDKFIDELQAAATSM